MFQGKTHSSRGWMLVALLLSTVVWFGPACAQDGGRDKKEDTTAELIERVENNAEFSQDRVAAAAKLGALRDPDEVRDQRLIDRILKVAEDDKADLFVRIACVNSLGTVQSTIGGDAAVNKYIEPFLKMIKDEKEEELLRVEIIGVFKGTIKFANLAEERAYEALIDMASSTGAATRHKMPLIVRIAAIRALEAGTRDQRGNYVGKAFAGLADILNQPSIDALARESAVTSFAALLKGLKDVGNDIKPGTISKIVAIVADKKADMYIRSEAMRAVARLYRMGVRGTSTVVMATIQKVLAEEEGELLLVAAVESLGITGDAAALPALEKAYNDMYVAAHVGNETDVRIRTAIMKTLGQLLDAQRSKRPSADAAAVAKMAAMLGNAIDPFSKQKEVSHVISAAIFSSRYLYPKESAFEKQVVMILEKLIVQYEKGEDKKIKPGIIDSLKIIARQPFGEDVDRWKKWLTDVHGIKVPVK